MENVARVTPRGIRRARNNVKVEKEGGVTIKEEEIPVDISTGPVGTAGTLHNIKAEGEDGRAMCVKEEEIPVDISTVTWNSGMVKSEKKRPVQIKEEMNPVHIGSDGQYQRIGHHEPVGGTTGRHNGLSVKDEEPVARALTHEEKVEILHQQMREMSGQGLDWGPAFPSNPKRDPNNPYHAPDPDPHKIGNTDWCSCKNCMPLRTGLESICCKEIKALKQHLKGIRCITRHKYFPYLCVNSDLVRVHRDMTSDRRTKSVKDKDKNRRMRRAAYRAFSVWLHGHLKQDGRRPIPACVVKKVREAFLEPGKPCNDYAAEYMVYDG